MLQVSTAHLRESEPKPDGSYRAVTILNRSPHGLMVWAGELKTASSDVGPDEVSPGDYAKREAVSFMAWQDSLEYFAGREYEPLVVELMRRYAGRLTDRKS